MSEALQERISDSSLEMIEHNALRIKTGFPIQGHQKPSGLI